MVVDASVIVALLARDPDARKFASKLVEAKVRYTSGVAILDAAARLSAQLDIDPVVVEHSIQALLDEASIFVIPVNASIASKAVAAFAAYGQDRGHPAQLSLADCLSYACAQAYRVPLLFKGERFALTDVRVA